MKKHYLLFLSLAVIAAKCPSDSDVEPDHSVLKIVLSDSLEVVDNDGILNVPESIRGLSDVIVSDEKNCKQNFVLDPSLIRLDQEKEFSLKTTITKGGAKDVSNPKVISKLIGKHLDELNVPKAFVEASNPSYRTAAKLHAWLNSKAPNDSVLVYSPDGPEKYSLGKRTYPTFADVEGVREHIRKALCQNAKANFTLLYNPPVGPVDDTDTDTETDTGERGGKGVKGNRGGKISVVPPPPPDGICDYDTHTLYERVRGEDGRDKRGKVLIMNCKACGYIANN